MWRVWVQWASLNKTWTTSCIEGQVQTKWEGYIWHVQRSSYWEQQVPMPPSGGARWQNGRVVPVRSEASDGRLSRNVMSVLWKTINQSFSLSMIYFYCISVSFIFICPECCHHGKWKMIELIFLSCQTLWYATFLTYDQKHSIPISILSLLSIWKIEDLLMNEQMNKDMYSYNLVHRPSRALAY